MDPIPFNPDPVIELLQMPYHLAAAFRSMCEASVARTPAEKLILMGSVQEHIDQELIRLRMLTQKDFTSQPERLFGAVLDTDYGLATEALQEAVQYRDSLRAKGDSKK